MSLLDAFKPKWQNSNPETRLNAVNELDIRDQEKIERIALSDDDKDVRAAAVKKLALIQTLSSISKNDADASVRRLAENRYYEEVVKKLKDFREPANAETHSYLDQIKDSRYAEDLVKNMKSSELRLELIQKCSKINLLAYAANKDNKEEIAKAAVAKIDTEASLQDIAKNSKHNSVRKIAKDKLNAIEKSKDNGQKEAALLFSKREALIQQAHSLAASKTPLEVKAQFEALMEEASKLGMGPAQDSLNEIYASFIKFCGEAAAEQIAAQKAAAEKAETIARLTAELDELESIIDGDQFNEREERIQEIVEEWQAKKNVMEAPAVKRFTLATIRIAEKKQTVPAVEVDENTPEDSIRPSLLERLQALAESEASDMTERHLRAIVREWEKLPLLEGADPILQSYNSFRNTLSEKIKAFNETAQKIVEENSVKLRGIIDRIKAINENENFKDINKSLREAFIEWKNIVGEQKFKYHDLWQEYKEATSRFQEMQQWESWHNEKDRDTILEEMDALSKETGSADVLSKLKELSNKWREIGPVSSTKFQEYKDKFQALFEKVRENCASFIEEQNAERLKNLTSKEELCQKAEELVSNAEICWKDKLKAMQEIQESWKNIGMVPKENIAALMERFKAATNAFYAQHKENLQKEDEVRESNYQKKVALCEEAEAIKDSTDWNTISNKFKQLQEAWKKSGPVPKAKSEEIWTRFRTACDAFFEKKRAHFEEMDADKKKNLDLKTAICEKLEAIDLNNITAEVIETVKGIQAQWETIGMIPKEHVETIFDRYSTVINQFLSRVAETDENLRKQLEEVKTKKQEIIDKIRQFAESAGSNQLADAVRALQQDWRALGSCGVDDLLIYKAYREACDDFFTRRRDQLDIQEQARQNNLQKKLLLCEQAEDLLTELNEETAGRAMNEVKNLRRLWKEVGAVPRSESEKVWQRFNTACDKVFAVGRPKQPEQPATETTEA